ncbi:UNVERIFIED_CONTAM: hypothetical protein K2H54_036123 [Gekko kuhli]
MCARGGLAFPSLAKKTSPTLPRLLCGGHGAFVTSPETRIWGGGGDPLFPPLGQVFPMMCPLKHFPPFLLALEEPRQFCPVRLLRRSAATKRITELGETRRVIESSPPHSTGNPQLPSLHSPLL